MKEIDNCLRQIAKIRLVAQGEEVAYVARSRLGRLVLGVGQLVGKVSGISVSDRPGRLTVPEDASSDVRGLMNLCNQLNDTAKTLVQPSEPLDERWRTGWSELMAELGHLEHHLQVMATRPLTTEWR